jgi:Flp pilus assembly pilin Flp
MPKLGAVLAIDSDVTVIEAALIACLIAVFIIVVFQLVGTTSATCSPRLATSSSEPGKTFCGLAINLDPRLYAARSRAEDGNAPILHRSSP